MKDRTIFIVVLISLLLFSTAIYRMMDNTPPSQDPIIEVPQSPSVKPQLPNPGITMPTGGEQEDYETEEEDIEEDD